MYVCMLGRVLFVLMFLMFSVFKVYGQSGSSGGILSVWDMVDNKGKGADIIRYDSGYSKSLYNFLEKLKEYRGRVNFEGKLTPIYDNKNRIVDICLAVKDNDDLGQQYILLNIYLKEVLRLDYNYPSNKKKSIFEKLQEQTGFVNDFIVEDKHFGDLMNLYSVMPIHLFLMSVLLLKYRGNNIETFLNKELIHIPEKLISNFKAIAKHPLFSYEWLMTKYKRYRKGKLKDKDINERLSFIFDVLTYKNHPFVAKLIEYKYKGTKSVIKLFLKLLYYAGCKLDSNYVFDAYELGEIRESIRDLRNFITEMPSDNIRDYEKILGLTSSNKELKLYGKYTYCYKFKLTQNQETFFLCPYPLATDDLSRSFYKYSKCSQDLGEIEYVLKVKTQCSKDDGTVTITSKTGENIEKGRIKEMYRERLYF